MKIHAEIIPEYHRIWLQGKCSADPYYKRGSEFTDPSLAN